MIKKVTPVPGFIDRLQEKEKITQIDISKKSTLSKDVLRKINDGKSVKLSTIQKLTKLDSVNLEDLPIKKNNYDDYETLDFCQYECSHPDWIASSQEKEKISKIDFIPSKVNNYDEFKKLIKFRPDKKFFRMNGPTDKLLNKNVKKTIKGLGELISSPKTFLKNHGEGSPSKSIDDCYKRLEEKNIAHKLLNELSSRNFQIYYGFWKSAVAYEDKHRFETLEHKKSGKPPTLVQTFGFESHLAVVFAEKSKKLKFKINRNLHVIPRLDHLYKKMLNGDLNTTDVGIEGLQVFDWFKENHYTLIEEEIESSKKYVEKIMKNIKKKNGR